MKLKYELSDEHFELEFKGDIADLIRSAQILLVAALDYNQYIDACGYFGTDGCISKNEFNELKKELSNSEE